MTYLVSVLLLADLSQSDFDCDARFLFATDGPIAFQCFTPPRQLHVRSMNLSMYPDIF